MIVKNILEEYRENINKLIFIDKELNFLNNEINDIGAVQLSEKTGATNKINNAIEKSYIEKEGKIEELALKKAYVNHYIELADIFIDMVASEEDRTILKMRYKDGEEKPAYSIIADNLNLSISGVRMRVERSIKEIEKIINLNKIKHERERGA